MKLSGKNFQPWANFEMDIEGLTVLVGPSNQGKSSLFRALQGIVRNDLPEEFVRNDQDDPMEVGLEVDGLSIKAARAVGKSTKYEVGTKKYSSLNGKIPEEVEKLKFGIVKIGDVEVDPIFAEQNKAQFLIDSDRWKPGQLNAILGAFSSTEKLDAGKKEANLRITQRKSEASTLATEIREAEERCALLLDLSGQASVVADSVLTLEKGIREDEILTAQIQVALGHRGRLEPLEGILESLTIPDLAEVGTLHKLSASMAAAAHSLSRSRFYRKVETAFTEIATAWSAIMTIYKQRRALSELLELKDKRGASPEESLAKLDEITNAVEADLVEAKRLNSRISYLTGAVATLHTLHETKAQLAEQDTLLEAAEEELEAVRQEAAAETAKKAAEGLCPKCGKSLEHTCQ